MTRDEALAELAKPAYDAALIGQDIEFVANKLDVSVDELMGYMTLPKKTYKDYRNQEEIYRFGAHIMRAIGLERGGKR